MTQCIECHSVNVTELRPLHQRHQFRPDQTLRLGQCVSRPIVVLRATALRWHRRVRLASRYVRGLVHGDHRMRADP